MMFLIAASLLNVTVNHLLGYNAPVSNRVEKCARNAEYCDRTTWTVVLCCPHLGTCDDTFEHPCCNLLESCKPTLWQDYKKCVKEAVLGAACERHEDCFEILNAECSLEKVCVCPPNYVVSNNKTCSPLLGAFCWNDELCMTENSYCYDFSCRCKPGFESRFDRVDCMPLQ